MDADKNALNRISERIIGCAFTVLNAMGPGFLEKVYENCLVYELRKNGLSAAQQHSIVIQYDGIIVGEYATDLLVDDCVIVELKAVRTLDSIHTTQCMNYLKATGLHLALLLNFGHPRLEVRRIVNNIQRRRRYLRPSASICVHLRPSAVKYAPFMRQPA